MYDDTTSEKVATTPSSNAPGQTSSASGALRSGLRGRSFADQIQMLAPAQRRPVQRAPAATTTAACVQREESGEGPMYQGVPVKKCMSEVCRGAGPSAVTNWGLPEPLLVQLGADLPLVDVLPGAARIVLSTPYGSATLGSDGKFKLGLKQGSVGGSVDSDGGVSGEVSVGPFKLGADSGGKATISTSGIKLTYDSASGDISAEFTRELSWGPAKVEGSRLPNGVKLDVSLNVSLSEGWSISIGQDYSMLVTVPPDEAQRAIIESTVDPFFDYVNGGAGTMSDLNDAYHRY